MTESSSASFHFHYPVASPSRRATFDTRNPSETAKVRLRYFLYARKSSEPDDRQALSIESQKKELLSRFGDLAIVEIIEESRTAKEPGRPKFEAMMKRLEKGEADGLIAWHPDRLSRNSVDAGRLIYDLDLGKIKDLKFAGYNFENTPEGKWMLSVILSQSKYFVDKLSKDVRRGMKMKLEMGWRPGVAPIGYLNNLADHKGLRTIIPDPERFPLVRKMWDLMLTGAYSPMRIMEIAEKDLVLRTLDGRKYGGRPVSRTGIYNIFTNPFYMGMFDYGGQSHEGKHVPMINEAEFWKVQALLGRKGRPRAKTKRIFAYTGLMRCGECGCMITAEEKIKRNLKTGMARAYLYYHCTRKKRHLQCHQPSIELQELEAQFGKALSPLSVNQDFLEWALQYLCELRVTELGAGKIQQENLERAYKSNANQLDELLTLRLRGMISDEEFETKRFALQREQTVLQAQMENPLEQAEKTLELVERTCKFALNLKTRFDLGSIDEKRCILETVGSNLTLKDKIVHFEPVTPFQFFQGTTEKSNWRGGLDDVRTFCAGATDSFELPVTSM